MNIADLRAMPECLTANPGIRQGATHRDMQGMSVAPGRDSEAGGGPHSPHMLDCLGNICNRLGVQHCQRVEMVSVPEIPGRELVVFEGEMAVEVKRLEGRRRRRDSGEAEIKINDYAAAC
nr:hypothetical protein Iba_chr12eCG0940 [Ipomoea batatas]